MKEQTIELRELSLKDGLDVLDMIHEIGPGENGFKNNGYDVDEAGFTDYLIHNLNFAAGKDLPRHWVPQTKFWLYVDGVPAGIGKVRHYLNDRLRKRGGHIGYCIRPSQREKGFGNIILAELLKKAAGLGIPKALVTCSETNACSRKVIEHNGGEYEGCDDGECRFRFKLTPLRGARDLHIDDHEEIYGLWRKTPGIGLSGTDGLQGFTRFMLRNKGMSQCFVDEGKIVAVALCGHDGRRGYINHVAVEESHKGKGIGREVVGRCLFRLKEEGIDKCHVFVFRENEQGKAFWKAVGWNERDDIDIYSRFV
ncbi:MAG: GNAT family N-acetyltransferase [Eubacteriales bacterium]|nr:GNAT family N-acetyltransferase [Eubacteriales bacterium]